MRPLALAVLALGIFAPSASGAVLRLEFEDCACDPSSGDVGLTTLVVRAAPGEVNRLLVEGGPGGSVLVSDAGAPLRGCRPAGSGGRLCNGIDGVEVELGDGDDATAVLSYVDRTEGVTIRTNGLADDGAAGEGDDLRGRITTMSSGSGDDVLEAGADRTFLTSGPATTRWWADRPTTTFGPARATTASRRGRATTCSSRARAGTC